MRVVLSDRALARLQSIRTYIARHNPTAAPQVLERIIRTAQRLSDNPLSGPRWRNGRTRALIVNGLPYRIHYAVNEAEGIVEVIHIAHTSQRPPRL
jgi:addiction module RelE/StbE family toxin